MFSEALAASGAVAHRLELRLEHIIRFPQPAGRWSAPRRVPRFCLPGNSSWRRQSAISSPKNCTSWIRYDPKALTAQVTYRIIRPELTGQIFVEASDEIVSRHVHGFPLPVGNGQSRPHKPRDRDA